ncbi:MAG: DUF6198 family protein [Oscillospiraceae bacterium]|nr:DUF6198 family protein [Oscillospiraceae bacterium]
MSRENLLRRALVYCFGLFVTALGVTMSVNANLGVSPVSSTPYVLSLIFPFTQGTFTSAMFIVFVLGQMLLLRRDYKWFNLAQLPASVLFGLFVDLTNFLFGNFRIPTYFGQLTMMVFSIVLIATGIVLFMAPQIVLLPSEGFTAAVAQKLNVPFHRVKVFSDSILSSIAILLSLIFLGGLFGVREGTVITAIFVGRVIPYARKAVYPILDKIIDTPTF